MNKYIAELVGTFVLVFGGVGSAVLAGSHIGFAGISAAFGLSLLAMVYTIGPISGCHVNPALTLGVFLAKKINARDADVDARENPARRSAGHDTDHPLMDT